MQPLVSFSFHQNANRKNNDDESMMPTQPTLLLKAAATHSYRVSARSPRLPTLPMLPMLPASLPAECGLHGQHGNMDGVDRYLHEA